MPLRGKGGGAGGGSGGGERDLLLLSRLSPSLENGAASAFPKKILAGKKKNGKRSSRG